MPTQKKKPQQPQQQPPRKTPTRNPIQEDVNPNRRQQTKKNQQNQ